MKIKSLGYLTFLMSFDNVDLVTDPLLLEEVGLKFPKTKADVILHTKDESVVDEKKVVPSKKKEVLNIHNPGEFELGGLMVRRDIGSDYYILDEDLLRVVYVGDISENTKPESFKNLGDVDVLIMPVGDGKDFPELSVIEKIVTQVEPLFLIPSAFKTSDMKSGQDLSSVDDFVKHAGYTNVRREKTLSVSGSVEKEVRNMDVVILE